MPDPSTPFRFAQDDNGISDTRPFDFAQGRLCAGTSFTDCPNPDEPEPKRVDKRLTPERN